MDRRFRGQQQTGNGCRVRQGDALDLERVDDPGVEHVDVFAGRSVEAQGFTLSLLNRINDDAGVETGVLRDLFQRRLHGAKNDLVSDLLVAFKVEFDFGSRADERRAATDNDPLFDCRFRRGERIVDAVFFLFHLRLRRRTDFDDRDTAGEFREAFLQFLLVVLGCRRFDLRFDLVDACLDGCRIAHTVDDRRIVFVDDDAGRLTEVRQRRRFERASDLLGDHLAARENRDVLQHRLAAVAEARRLDRGDIENTAQFVDDQRRQCFTLDVFGDDQQRAARFLYLFQHRQQVFEVADLLIE